MEGNVALNSPSTGAQADKTEIPAAAELGTNAQATLWPTQDKKAVTELSARSRAGGVDAGP